jgi:YbbR domain-containing protein
MAFHPFQRIGLKIISVVLAALIWLIVSGEQIVERGFRIPLEFSNLPVGLELASDAPTVVDVRVRGSSGALGRLTPGELVAILDLRQARAGQRLFHLSGDEVRAPFGVDVVHVAPSSLAITFEPSAEKQVAVSPVVEGEPAAGFEVRQVTADPAIVVVSGPTTAVRATNEAITEPVSVAGAASTVTEVVNVGVADPVVHLRSSEAVRVTVTIARRGAQ